MKAVMISIRPEWCEKIISGEKTVELRKSFPTADKVKTPVKCYIYCTKGFPMLWKDGEKAFIADSKYEWLHFTPDALNGKVIGEFVCDALYWAVSHPDTFAGHPCFHRAAIESACLTMAQAQNYSNGKNVYGWHISELVIYDTPKELMQYKVECDKNCEDCAWWLPTRVNADEIDMDCASPVYAHKPLTRPPQSWCYVEDGE